MKWILWCSAAAAVACSGNGGSCPKSSSLGQQVKDKVDVLFLVDDSPSMAPKQAALKAAFGDLLKQMDNLGAGGNPVDIHIGVVTSDLGADTGSTACTPGGLGARLQPLGRAHDPTCSPPTGGLNFIDYNQITNTNNLPVGQDLVTTFDCMASVGDTGCGFEHQLEAAYKALHDCPPTGGCTIPENAGFLRPDSLLVVVLVTDEDDCSAPPDTDLFDVGKTASYGAETSYRCTNWGIQCLQNGSESLMPYADSGGALMSCQSAPNPNGAGPGKLYDLSRYVDFFTQPASAGGVRVNPADVLLVALDAPSTPVASVLENPMNQQSCPSGSAVGSSQCIVALAHSCSPSAQLFGDPAVRINQLLGSSVNTLRSSICDSDYAAFMTSLGQQVAAQVLGGGPTSGGGTGSTTGTSGSTTGTSGGTTGTSGGTTGTTTGGTTGTTVSNTGATGSGGCSTGSGGKFDNVAACQDFVKKVQCGTTDVSMYIDCSAYSGLACDVSPYFTCLEPKYVCVNGSYDPNKLATAGDCASKATCP